MVELNLSLPTVQPVLREDEEGAAGWKPGLGEHTVVTPESWRRITERFLDQRAGRRRGVLQRVLSSSVTPHGSNIWDEKENFGQV